MVAAVVVEDGTIVAGANSYNSVAEADDLFEDDPTAAEWNAASDEAKAFYTVEAARFLEARWRYYGDIAVTGQSMQWPRTANYDDKGCIIPPGTIPKQLKDAQFALMKAFSKEPTLAEGAVSASGVVKSWASDGLSITFDTQAMSKTGGSSSGGGGSRGQFGPGGDSEASDILLGVRYVTVEFNLRSIGVFKNVDWLQTNLRTDVKMNP